MNVLALTPYVSWPLDHGGRIRTHHLLRALARDHHVTNLAVARTPGERFDAEALARTGIVVKPILIPIHDPTPAIVRLAKWTSIAMGRSSLPPRWRAPGFAQAVRETVAAQRFDLAVVDTLWMAVYRAELGRLPYLASTHNVESDVLLEAAARHHGASRFVASRDARLLASVEGRYCDEARVTLAVTEDDASRFRSMAPSGRVEVVENGVDLERTPLLPPATGSGPVLFVGSFDYTANVDAARFFALEIMPALRARDPDATAILAGRRPGPEVHALGSLPGIEVAGAVADLKPLYARASAVVVPIQVGGGSRIKILEALAHGRAVVTTAVGVRGLHARDGVEVLVADAPDAIAAALARVRTDAALRARLVAAGRAFVEGRHSWRVLEDRFAAVAAAAGAAR